MGSAHGNAGENPMTSGPLSSLLNGGGDGNSELKHSPASVQGLVSMNGGTPLAHGPQSHNGPGSAPGHHGGPGSVQSQPGAPNSVQPAGASQVRVIVLTPGFDSVSCISTQRMQILCHISARFRLTN